MGIIDPTIDKYEDGDLFIFDVTWITGESVELLFTRTDVEEMGMDKIDSIVETYVQAHNPVVVLH